MTKIKNIIGNRLLKLWLCVALLAVSLAFTVGSTFAWFTAEIVSSGNIISAGNFEIEFTHADGEAITENTTLFDNVTHWEPGVMSWENFTVKNKGDLAVKYELELLVGRADENTPDLSGTLTVAVVDGGFEGGRSDALALEYSPLTSFSLEGVLDAENNTERTVGIVIYWKPTSNDNAYRRANATVGVSLFATQATSSGETDSFGGGFDAGAPLLPVGVKAEDFGDNVAYFGGVFYKTLPEAVSAASASGAAAKTVYLKPELALDRIDSLTLDGISIVGNGATFGGFDGFTDLTVGKGGATLSGFIFDADINAITMKESAGELVIEDSAISSVVSLHGTKITVRGCTLAPSVRSGLLSVSTYGDTTFVDCRFDTQGREADCEIVARAADITIDFKSCTGADGSSLIKLCPNLIHGSVVTVNGIKLFAK